MLAPSKDNLVDGRVVELVDTPDLKSGGPKGPCGFESHLGYRNLSE